MNCLSVNNLVLIIKKGKTPWQVHSLKEAGKDFFVPKTTKTKQNRFLKVIIRLLPQLLIKLCFI